MRPLLIGQAPGPNTDPRLPLFPVPSTSAGGRLAEMTGLGRAEYLKTFERVNLLPDFPGKTKKEDMFPVARARFAAKIMKPFLAGRTVVLVGRGVSTAFGLDPSFEFHKWFTHPVKRRCAFARDSWHARVVIIPHPSGRSRWYNDDANRALSIAFWTEFSSRDWGDFT